MIQSIPTYPLPRFTNCFLPHLFYCSLHLHTCVCISEPSENKVETQCPFSPKCVVPKKRDIPLPTHTAVIKIGKLNTDTLLLFSPASTFNSQVSWWAWRLV